MSNSSNLCHRADIDGLRAIAVLAVVAFHATKRISGGFVGVDVFFVISGFLISGTILNLLNHNSFSFTDFYVRRIRRIFPALLLVLFCSWLLGWLVLGPSTYALLGWHMVAGVGFFSNILLYSESSYFDPSHTSKPLLHLWSLGIEEQFYLVWPWMLIFARKFKLRVHVFIFILLVGSFIVNISGVHSNPVGTFYLPLSRFWELLAGALLAYHLHHFGALDSKLSSTVFQLGKISVSLRSLSSVLGLLLIVASIFVVDESSSFPGWWALLPTLGAMLLIASGSSAWINRTILSNKWMTAIGLISYPLYLWHWPLLTFARMTSIGMDQPRLTTLSMVSLAFLLSALTYRLVEKPLRYSVIWKPNQVAKLLLGGMILLGSLGALTYFQNGWSSRYPQAARTILDYQFDFRESFRNHRCLLSGSEVDFAAECASVKAGVPILMIWGDSHGAMLYRALDSVAPLEGLSVAQFTSSSCPPILDFDKKDRPLCRGINDGIFKRIVELRPATVVLAHDWPQSVLENSLVKLPATIQLLRSAGVQRIVLVGPVPHWGMPLSAKVVRFIQSENTINVPDRIKMPNEFGQQIKEIDNNLKLLSKKYSIHYVASYESFCDLEDCLVTLNKGEIKDLIAFDDAHLKQIGAKFLVEKNKNIFFAEIIKDLKVSP